MAGSMVLIEFPSLAEARSWCDSPAYRAILLARTDHVEGDLVLIEGVGPSDDPAERARTLRTEACRAVRSTASSPLPHPGAPRYSALVAPAGSSWGGRKTAALP